MKQMEDDYQETMQTLIKVRTALDQLELEHAALKTEYSETVNNNSSLSRDNKQLKKCTIDLSRQVMIFIC